MALVGVFRCLTVRGRGPVRPVRILAAIFAAVSAAAAQGLPALNLRVLGGDGAVNNIRRRTARAPVVEVSDHNHRPVAGAAVSFLLPAGGPGGAFSGGRSVLVVLTNAQGRAVAAGFRPNQVPGLFKINVTASLQGHAAASAVISQSNALVGALLAATTLGTAGTVAAVGGGAAAAAVVGVKVASGPDSTAASTPPPAVPPITITTWGPPVFGPASLPGASPGVFGRSASALAKAFARPATGGRGGLAGHTIARWLMTGGMACPRSSFVRSIIPRLTRAAGSHISVGTSRGVRPSAATDRRELPRMGGRR